jgi:hypothetical protein
VLGLVVVVKVLRRIEKWSCVAEEMSNLPLFCGLFFQTEEGDEMIIIPINPCACYLLA